MSGREEADRDGTVRSCDPQRGITLVELLVVMIIMSIIGAMLVVTWVSLSDSFATTTRNSDARDYARQAASRMEREIRDAQAQLTTGPYSGQPAVLWASANRIVVVTTFNIAGNAVPDSDPLAVMYYLEDGTLYTKRDADNDGSWDGELARAFIPHMVNGSVGASGSTPIFSYTYVDSSGHFLTASPTGDTVGESLTEAQRDRITSVSFTLLVDLNPGHTPTHMTLTSTAQLRNQRRF